MNNKGSIGLGILVGITLFLVGMIAVNFLITDVTTARGSAALDCSNSSVSDGNKLTCLMVDFVVPYWFIIVVSVAGGLIVGRVTK